MAVDGLRRRGVDVWVPWLSLSFFFSSFLPYFSFEGLSVGVAFQQMSLLRYKFEGRIWSVC